MKIHFQTGRDLAAAAAATAVPFGPGSAVGFGAKKLLIAKDSSALKTWAVGIGVAVATGFTGQPAYLIAAAGRQTRDEVDAARATAVTGRC